MIEYKSNTNIKLKNQKSNSSIINNAQSLNMKNIFI